VYLKRVGGGSALVALMGGRGRGGLVHPRILITCPGSQGTSCPCSLFMIRVEVPGSSFMLCLGPGPPSLLCMTRANEKSPYAGGTLLFYLEVIMEAFKKWAVFNSVVLISGRKNAV
jgi:hypothetical protein